MKDACGRQPFVQKQEIRLGALAVLLSVIYCASTGRKKGILTTLKTARSFHRLSGYLVMLFQVQSIRQVVQITINMQSVILI
jgi:hypothetical protein